MNSQLVAQQRSFVNEVKARWLAGARPCAEEVLRDQPFGAWEDSISLELAYEEYCLRCEAGEAPEIAAFVAQFPQIGKQLRQQIEIHRALESQFLLRPLPQTPWPEVGEEIAGFRLCEEFGRGSVGRVYLAEQMNLGQRKVVVKISPASFREASLLAQAPHPNVVPIYNVEQDEDTQLSVMCMPFVGHATLRQIIAQFTKPPAYDELLQSIRAAARNSYSQQPARAISRMLLAGPSDIPLQIGQRLCDALAFVHGCGVIHGDIKPDNILIDFSGQPVLIDFSHSQNCNSAVGLGGTLPYMAPEQLAAIAHPEQSGHAFISNSQSDLYALGITIAELMLGHHPLAGVPLTDNRQDSARALLAGHAQMMRSGIPVSDPGVRALLMKMLAADPMHRPVQAGDLLPEFRRLRSLSARVGRWQRAHPRLRLAATGLVFAALGVLMTWSMTRPSRIERARMEVLRQIEGQDANRAIMTATNALVAFPEDPSLLTLRGLALMKILQGRQAQVDLLAAWEIHPTPEYENLLAYCSMESGNYDEAVKWYFRYLHSAPQDADALNNLGFALFQLEDYAAAIHYLDNAIALNDQHDAARFNRASALFRQSLRLRKNVPDSALADIQQCRLTTGDVALLGAEIASQFGAESLPLVQAYLKRAVEQGLDRQRLERNSFFEEWRQDDWFQELVAAAKLDSQIKRAVRVIAPPTADVTRQAGLPPGAF